MNLSVLNPRVGNGAGGGGGGADPGEFGIFIEARVKSPAPTECQIPAPE